MQMNRGQRSCELQRVDAAGPALQLGHAQPLVVGRSPLTKVIDPNCSRKQLILTADYDARTVSVKQIGTNPSGVDGFALSKDTEIIVGDNAHIELLINEYIYKVKFSQLNGEKSDRDENKLKRKSTFDLATVSEVKKQKIDETSTDKFKTVSNDVNSTMENSFENLENGLLYILTTDGVKSSSKIAAYDMDGTLIKTKSGRVFPKDTYDWQIAFPEVPRKLKEYQNAGYKIIIFTNQASIGNKKLKPTDFKKKVESILKRIGVSAQAFISTGHGHFRKPSTGMWETLVSMKNDGIEIDMTQSFYCGDAAGRKTDHSFADRFFADNIGLKFLTPEEHFKGFKNGILMDASFNPKSIDMSAKYPDIIKNKQEILVLVGFPGCGKSSFSTDVEIKSKDRYKSVCRDVLGSWQKCASQAEKLLKMDKSIVVDSTNLDVQSRERWIGLARNYKLDCRCVLFDVTIPHCKHNNLFRQKTDKRHLIVTDMVFNTCKGKYKEPNSSEGFTEIIKIKFAPNFKDVDTKNLYMKHYLDK